MTNALIRLPRSVKRGEAFEIKTLIQHPMETGFRAGTNGTTIPRDIIEEFLCTYNGVEIFRMKLSSAIAANPYISFHTVATESGTLFFRWTGDNGFKVEETARIAVA
ncbi:MAG: thiosulfate oxidation carrier complex protein SoxZ [Alphaproteobacteria bacterium]|nr:thiosulfate oxidation carrier complex protein SoxZ [Alphaproteobacteria bacterium]